MFKLNTNVSKVEKEKRIFFLLIRVDFLDYSIQDICQKQDIRSTQGFLSTPTYPNGFFTHLNCPCTLIPSINHSIIFELIDLSLPNCSEANLLLRIGHEVQNRCQKQNPVTLISQIHENITMRFFSLKNTKHGGILMKYSVSPESKNGSIRVQCSGSLTNNRSVVIGQFINTKNQNEIEQNDDDEEEDEEVEIPTANTTQFRTDLSVKIFEVLLCCFERSILGEFEFQSTD